jgi:hypothetical protein
MFIGVTDDMLHTRRIVSSRFQRGNFESEQLMMIRLVASRGGKAKIITSLKKNLICLETQVPIDSNLMLTMPKLM